MDGMGCHKDFVAVALLLLEVPVVQVVKFWGFQKRSRFLPTKRGYLWTSKTHWTPWKSEGFYALKMKETWVPMVVDDANDGKYTSSIKCLASTVASPHRERWDGLRGL